MFRAAGGDLCRYRHFYDGCQCKAGACGRGDPARAAAFAECTGKNTAQLPQIDLVAKAPASILGKSTSSCLQNGFVLGTASLLDGLAERFCAELGPQTAFYATGSLPAAIREACRTPILYRETLITDGLYRIWMKNKKG